MTDPGRDNVLRDYSARQSLREVQVDLPSARQHTDFAADHDRRMDELAREAAAAAAHRAEPVLVAPSDQLTDMSLLPDRLEFDLLADARANIQDGEYELAEQQLAEFLETEPGHQEARFLRAYCLFKLGGDDRGREALRILWDLLAEPGGPGLLDQARALRGELRHQLAPRMVLEYTKTAKTNPDAALARVREFVRLVPEDGTLAYILALGLALKGDLGGAFDEASRGAAEADTGRDRVSALARVLLRVAAPTFAGPAIDAFRAGNLERARLELDLMDPRWRDNTLLDDFNDYISLLLSRPGQVPRPAPRLPWGRAEDLYSLVAEPDCEEAARLLKRNQAGQAERVLAGALSLAPRFGWLNFLYAVCLYRLDRDPDRAELCAEIAARDPSIPEAGALQEAIREWQEVRVISPALDEYDAIMRASGEITSPGQLDGLRDRLVALQRRIPGLREAARTQSGTRVLQELGNAITKRLSEIDGVRKSLAVSGEVTALVGRFNRLSDQRNPVIIRSELTVIRREAQRLRGSNPAAADRKLLDEMIAAIGKVFG